MSNNFQKKGFPILYHNEKIISVSVLILSLARLIDFSVRHIAQWWIKQATCCAMQINRQNVYRIKIEYYQQVK